MQTTRPSFKKEKQSKERSDSIDDLKRTVILGQRSSDNLTDQTIKIEKEVKKYAYETNITTNIIVYKLNKTIK